MAEDRERYSILIADDDINVHHSLGMYFHKADYEVISAFDGAETLAMVKRHKPSLLILDIMMPRMDGFTVCSELRKISNIPIIMLTAKSEEFDTLLGLEIGADDYISKPFSPREVLGRTRAILRRMYEMKYETRDKCLTVGNLQIDMDAFVVRLEGEPVTCTAKEMEILWVLASHPGKVFSREKMLQDIWGYDFAGDTRAVDSHIKRIRAKLCREGNPWDICTVWGVGYKFVLLHGTEKPFPVS